MSGKPMTKNSKQNDSSRPLAVGADGAAVYDLSDVLVVSSLGTNERGWNPCCTRLDDPGMRRRIIID